MADENEILESWEELDNHEVNCGLLRDYYVLIMFKELKISNYNSFMLLSLK